jgi:hypothetical protein
MNFSIKCLLAVRRASLSGMGFPCSFRNRSASLNLDRSVAQQKGSSSRCTIPFLALQIIIASSLFKRNQSLPNLRRSPYSISSPSFSKNSTGRRPFRNSPIGSSLLALRAEARSPSGQTKECPVQSGHVPAGVNPKQCFSVLLDLEEKLNLEISLTDFFSNRRLMTTICGAVHSNRRCSCVSGCPQVHSSAPSVSSVCPFLTWLSLTAHQ